MRSTGFVEEEAEEVRAAMLGVSRKDLEMVRREIRREES